VCRARYLLGHDPAARAHVARGFATTALAGLLLRSRAIVVATDPHLESAAVVTT
jgi:hypothetical protein